MNDMDLDKLLPDDLPLHPADRAFKEQLKQQTDLAFSSGYQRRRQFRTACTTGLAMLLLSLAFWIGRNTITPNTGRQVAIAPDAPAGTVRVSQDMVTWLETARFFTRLGMEQRANNAFAQAGELVPQDTQVATHRFTEPLQPGRLAELLARCDQQQTQVDSYSTGTQASQNKQHYSLIAIGGMYHD